MLLSHQLHVLWPLPRDRTSNPTAEVWARLQNWSGHVLQEKFPILLLTTNLVQFMA